MKIRWTKEEKALIVDQAINLHGSVKTAKDKLALFRVAMEVLPPERHREVKTLTMFPWFMPMYLEKLKPEVSTENLVKAVVTQIMVWMARIDTQISEIKELIRAKN